MCVIWPITQLRWATRSSCMSTSSLTEVGDMLYSEEAGAVYPVVAGIPCLRPSNAILATKYLEAFDATGALIDPESFLDSPG